MFLRLYPSTSLVISVNGLISIIRDICVKSLSRSLKFPCVVWIMALIASLSIGRATCNLVA